MTDAVIIHEAKTRLSALSAVTIWEISIKQTLGKLTLPEEMERGMEKDR